MKYMYSRYFGKIYEVTDQYLEEMNEFRKFVEENKSWVEVLLSYALGTLDIDVFDEEEALEHPLLLARRLFIRKPITKDDFIVAVQFPIKNTKDDYFQVDAFSASKLGYDDYQSKRFEFWFREHVRRGNRYRLKAKKREFGEHDMSYLEKIGMGEVRDALEFENGKLKAFSVDCYWPYEETKKELLEERQFILSKKFKRNATKEEFDEAMEKFQKHKTDESCPMSVSEVDCLIETAVRAQGTELEQYFRNELVYKALKNVDKNEEEANEFLELKEEKQ